MTETNTKNSIQCLFNVHMDKNIAIINNYLKLTVFSHLYILTNIGEIALSYVSFSSKKL